MRFGANRSPPKARRPRAREALTFLFEKEKTERSELLILHHVLVIIDTLELDPIPSRVVNRELRRLDLPEAKWYRYRGPGGGEYAHPLTLDEQATLLRKSKVEAERLRPPEGESSSAAIGGSGSWKRYASGAPRRRQRACD